MTIRRLVVIGAAVLGACTSTGRRPAPVPAPRPTASEPRATEPRATGQAADDSAATIAAAARVGAASAAAVARHADSLRVSMHDVERLATQVFGDSAEDAGDEGEAENGPSWDMDVESYLAQDRVEHFVRMFSGSARDRIAARLERGTRYEPMIRERLRAGGLPEDMYYLALIESGFDPHAYSRAAAVGMWQFMTSTGRGLGLRIDWWVDERRDPVRSTSAAVRFIRGLRSQFGSLYLAAAAYNGGPGRVARGLKRFEDELEGEEGEDVFFALAEQDYLHKETKDYVPQLIAAALVAKDPARYGLTFRTLPPFAYDSVRVGPESSLPAIARAAGVTVADLQDLNPQLIRGMTPPRTEWMVRIPVGTRERFERAWEALDREERGALRRVVTKKGSTVDGIAEAHGITTRQLLAFNPSGVKRSKKGRVVSGQTLLVPDAAVAKAALVVPDPAIERYGSASKRTGKRRSVEYHVVRRGESLSTIARKYRTTTAALQRLNRLRKPLIFPGQSLVVRSDLPAERRASSSRRGTARVTQAGRARSSRSPSTVKATSASAKRSTAKKASSSKESKSSSSAKRSTARATTGSKSSRSSKAASAKSTKSSAKSSAKSSSKTSAKSSKAASGAKKKGAAPKSGARAARRADS